MRPYSEAVKADVRRRMGPPHRQNVAEISQELGIHVISPSTNGVRPGACRGRCEVVWFFWTAPIVNL
jgi:hypothetical protein